MTPEKITAGLAVSHLYRRYQLPEWFGVHELKLGNSSAWQAERRADFVAVRLWGGGFGPVLGFEVKVSRSDFLHEMSQPDKRRPIEDSCHACYFVAPAKVLAVEELPEGWGWIEVQAQGLRMRREAKHQKRDISPGFLHGVMKRLIDDRWHDRARRPAVYDIPKELWKLAGLEVTPAQLITAGREMFRGELDKARDEGRKEAREHRQAMGENASKEIEELRRTIMQATGLGYYEVRNLSILKDRLEGGFDKESGLATEAYGEAIGRVETLLDVMKRNAAKITKAKAAAL